MILLIKKKKKEEFIFGESDKAGECENTEGGHSANLNPACIVYFRNDFRMQCPVYTPGTWLTGKDTPCFCCERVQMQQAMKQAAQWAS